MTVEIYTKSEIDALLDGGSSVPSGISSRPVHAEDFSLSTTGDNTSALQAAIDAARGASRWLYIPPGEFRISGELNASGVDIRGTQGGLGARIVQTADNLSAITFTGRDPAGNFDTRGSVRDLLIFSEGAGKCGIEARGDSEHQPDHLRIERVRIGGLNGGSWSVPLVVNGLDRDTGVIGNRGLHIEGVLIFSARTNHVVLRGVNDAYLGNIRCYVPFSGSPAFWLGGSSAVYNENIYAFGCEAPAFYAEYTRNSRIMGQFASISKDVNTTPGLTVTT